MADPIVTKRCPRCTLTKALSDFPVLRTGSRKGPWTYCKPCTLARAKLCKSRQRERWQSNHPVIGTFKGYILRAKHVNQFWSKVRIMPSGCWEWQGTRIKHGYGRWSKKRIFPHRLAYFLYYCVDPGPLFVCHRCDNPPCCNPFHLFVGTPTDNVHDMDDKGRRVVHKGGKHPQSKLTDDDVLIVRQLRRAGWSRLRIADHFHVSESLIQKMDNGQTRSHVI